ncbi:acetate/propionate family kinase [Derxia lacustris]|uniref:acetate/propionate family kinase n=1 Tax=Derxia lacustris TaxID=764842 RepID=UPI000A170EF1|nr:acetate/propionate family kinase [Derxia lacustris]
MSTAALLSARIAPPTAAAARRRDGASLLTLNAGSSSIKFALFAADGPQLGIVGQIEGIGATAAFHAHSVDGRIDEHHAWQDGHGPIDHADALTWIIAWLAQKQPGLDVVAVGHRVVHGGLAYAAPVLIDDDVVNRLAQLEPLAPLHQPHNLAGVAAARAAFGRVPQVACFDTAFHRDHPFVNDTFALPRELYDAGVRRYGFHGLSYEYIALRLRESFPMHVAGRVLVAHLGNGASMCAMRDGRSVASTMGFSALDGLPMGTRCGQLDPGVLLYLMQHEGMRPEQIAELLYKRSGLKGLSGGLSHDMRTLEAAGTREADEAIDYFVFRIKREIGGLAAALEGLDAVVFTGGIGENSARIRARVLQGMAWLGIELDEARNRAGDTVISSTRSRVLCLRIPTDEEGMIARHTLEVAFEGARA